MAEKGGNHGPRAERKDEEPLESPSPDLPVNRALDPALYDRGFEFMYGDVVHDEEEFDPSDLVVVNIPGQTVGEWKAKGRSITDPNPKCPPDELVIIVVDRDVLNKCVPTWDQREAEIPLKQLSADDVPYSAFPALRLKIKEESHLR